MQNITENLNEQLKNMMDLQTRSLESVRIFAGLAADTFEQVARQNYAVAGDVLEYSAKAVNLPLSSDKFQEVTSAQVAESSSFAELMSTRASEYAEMAQAFNDKAREAAEAAAASFK